MRYWKKLTAHEQDERITAALKQNIDYTHKICLGIPASKLDPHVFNEQASFLKDAPLLRVYVQNPNHIGCHTFGHSEPFFRGTQELEKEVIALLGTDLFKAADDACDGYIASGGTEANIQAVWMYRNYFIRECNATHDQIALLCSTDTHYSAAKAANLLNIKLCRVGVDEHTRKLKETELNNTLREAAELGVRHFIVLCNMGTTMFGSIDDPGTYLQALQRHNVTYKIHVDGAFGGFVYPMSNPVNHLGFSNPDISSITLDAHKMLQAPYGTGILLVRKGLMQYTTTTEASYVSGMDMTLSGSRGGVNAVAVWMILFTYGPYGWLEKINKLLYRTDWLCRKLNEIGIAHYRHPMMNIVTLRADQIAPSVAEEFSLVPDDHEGRPNWYKIVVMDHVSIDDLHQFVSRLLPRYGLANI
jgi:tyrosine decarboxylase / aspartate 1-decarboxylase